MKKGIWKPSLAALATGIAIFLALRVLDYSETKRFQEQERADILNQLSTVRARLEASINSTLLLINGLVAYTSTHPNLTQGEFTQIARVIKAKNPKIRSLDLAKNTVISHIYPLEGNEGALGLDLAANPEQNKAVKQTIKTRKQVVAGPVDLVQGGLAFINRSVVFVTPPDGEPESGNYWGLAHILVDVDRVYEESGLFDHSTEFNYALRGKDGLGASGEVFCGDAQIFEQEPVFLSVTLPNGSWQLAAIPQEGWSSSSPLSIWIWTAGGVTAILASSLVFILVSAPQRLQIAVDKATAALQKAKEKLAQANETLEDKVKERTAELAQANEQITALNEQLKLENRRMGAELDVARQIQQMVLPKLMELEVIKGIDLAGFMEPADEVGGDYYDVLHADDVVTIGIGDVTGHGLESGILMLMTQTAVRTLQEIKERNPVRFLDTLNRTIYKNVQRMNSEKNLTLAILNYSEGRVSISGQHEETLVVRSGGHIERIDTMDLGLPIGMDDDIADFINHTIVELNSGDGVVLYTDGIPEAFDLDKKQYGMERLCEVISHNWQHSAQAIKQAVINDVRAFIGKQKVFDDITLVILKQQ